jgi:demethylmenaquinone methyltransferase/2-methoxy-6-polyprenyl-1,4-benzoquinol methylase
MKRNPLPSYTDKQSFVQGMFDRISPKYDLVNRLMTFGLDQGWRREVVRRLDLGPGQKVLDVACGTGDFLKLLRTSSLDPTGVDLSFGMLKHNHSGAALVQGSAVNLPFRDASFSGLTCGFAIRNFTELKLVYAEFARVVKSEGRVGILEVATPKNPLIRAGHSVYFNHIVPVIGGAMSDQSAYRYLPQSVEYLPSEVELQTMMSASGFCGFERVPVGLGAAQIIMATRS